MRKISTLGLSMAILAAAGWLAQASAQPAPDSSAPAPSSDSSTAAPADAAPAAKPMHKHHAAPKGIHRGTPKGDAAVEDLNAQSLSAAKSGTAFKPATTPTPAKAPMKGMKGMHHHHKKAAAAPAADASAPAPDAAAPAPDSSK